MNHYWLVRERCSNRCFSSIPQLPTHKWSVQRTTHGSTAGIRLSLLFWNKSTRDVVWKIRTKTFQNRAWRRRPPHLLLRRDWSESSDGVSNSCLWNSTFILRLSRTGSGSAALVVLKPSYPRGLDCKMMIQAPENSRVLLSYREVDLRWNLDASCLDYIQVEEPMCRRTFELDETHHHASNTPLLTAFVHTNKGGSTLEYRGFTLVATAFTTAGNGSQEDEFQCLNGNIVWSGLTCDGHNNCGDLSDEDPGGSSNCRSRSSAVLVVLGVLIIGALVLMCGVTLLCTKNDAVRRFSGRLRARTITFLPTRRPSTR